MGFFLPRRLPRSLPSVPTDRFVCRCVFASILALGVLSGMCGSPVSAQPLIEPGSAPPTVRSETDPPAPGDRSEPADRATPSGTPSPTTTPKPTADERIDTKPGVGTGSETEPGLIYLPNADGELVPVRRDGTLEDYLAWRAARDAPAYYLGSVTLTGTADDERATLTVEITVHVKQPDRWLRVPLGLTEAVLQNTKHIGAGESSFDAFTPGRGYSWWFRGEGKHVLTLDLIVPIQKQTPSRRLLLTVPEAASSRLALTIPETRIAVTAPPMSALRTEQVTEKDAKGEPKPGTLVEVFGLPARFDLEWKLLPNPRQVRTQIQSFTSMSVELASESVLLTAWQRVQVLQGSVSELTIETPPGFELIELERDGVSIGARINDPNRPDVVTIPFQQDLVGQTNLKWVLSYPLPEQNREIILTDFRIRRSARQTGEIALRTSEGWRIRQRSEESQFVYRIGSEDFIRPDLKTFLEMAPATASYRYLKGEFRLVVELEEIPPAYSAQPEMTLTVSRDQLTLDGRFQFQVYRGGLQEVTIRWTDDDWTLEPVQAPQLIEQVTRDRIAGETVLRVRMVDRQTNLFTVPIRATRKLTPPAADSERTEPTDPAESESPVPSQRVVFSLPRADTTRFLPTQLTVIAAENVEVDLRPVGETRYQEIAVSGGTDDNRGREYRMLSPNQELEAALTVHDRELTTETTVDLFWNGDGFDVRQRMVFDIRYDRLSEVRLNVPARLLERGLRYTLGDDIVPTTELSGIEIGSLRQVTVDLGDNRRGQIELTANWTIPAPADFPREETPLTLPILQSADVSWNRIVFESDRSQAVSVSLVNEDDLWLGPVEFGDTILWETDVVQSAIPLRLVPPEQLPGERLHIPRAVFFSAADDRGTIRTRAQYVVSGEVAEIPVTLPEGVRLDAVYWNTAQLPSEAILNRSVGGSETVWELRPPLPLTTTPLVPTPQPIETGDNADRPTDSPTGLLTLDLIQTAGSPLKNLSAVDVRLPTLGDGTWIEQSQARINLPPEQILLTDPTGWTTRYRWMRSLMLFSRVPEQSPEQLLGWLGLPGPETAPFPLTGNSYLFNRFGEAEGFSLRLIHRSALILIGAGVALFFGFILARAPRTRHPLTVLLAGFVVSLFALIWPGPTLLFLQPMMLGLMLALVVTLVDRRVGRRAPAPILTLPGSEENYLSRSRSRADDAGSSFQLASDRSPQATVIQSQGDPIGSTSPPPPTPTSPSEALTTDTGVGQ